MALMPTVRHPSRQQQAEGVPWTQVAMMLAVASFLLLLGTGKIHIAPAAAFRQPPSGNSNPAARWHDAPKHGLTMQMPHWLGASARLGSGMVDGPPLDATVRQPRGAAGACRRPTGVA